MDAVQYNRLRAQARRLVGNAADADDRVQQTLLAALLAGRDEPAWLSGVLRRQCLFAARSERRRRSREHRAGEQSVADAWSGAGAFHAPISREDPAELQGWLQTLPAGSRRLARLALHGLCGEEIRSLLALTPAAFRQRLASLRKVLDRLPPGQRQRLVRAAHDHHGLRHSSLPGGLLRRALKAALLRVPARLATHDDDGHLLLIGGRPHVLPSPGN